MKTSWIRWSLIGAALLVAYGVLYWRFGCNQIVARGCARGPDGWVCSNEAAACMINHGARGPVPLGVPVRFRSGK
jgi:hypothetical protein